MRLSLRRLFRLVVGCSSVQHPSERVMNLQGRQELYFRAHTANVVPDKLAIPARCPIVVLTSWLLTLLAQLKVKKRRMCFSLNKV